MRTNLEFPVVRVTIIAMLLMRAFMMTAQQCILGTTNINAFIKEVPSLPKTTGAAAERAYGANPLQQNAAALDAFYQPFEDKVNNRIAEYKRYAQQQMATGGTEAEYQQQAGLMADKSPIIANMGGYEKVSQMNKAEAKKAAEQAASQYAANPFSTNGIQSAGMNALYQKIIGDPAYAKKFEKMSDAEKEAELRKYMANDQPVVKSPAEIQQQQRASEQQQFQADRIRNAQEIQLKIVEWQQEMSGVAMDYAQQSQEIEQQGRSHEVISKEYGKKHEAIPMVSLGEYGSDHDPEQVRKIKLEEAKLHRERAQEELVKYNAAISSISNRYQSIVSEYLAYLNQNKSKIYGGTSAKDMMEATNTEQPLLGFEMSLIGTALQLNDYSKEITQKTAQWEANYLQAMQIYR